MKRRFGNNMMRPVSGILAVVVLFLAVLNPDWMLFLAICPLLLVAIVQNLGKEMIEIDFEKNTIRTNFQVIFDFSRSEQKFSNVDYILVRDFGTMNSHTIVGSDSGYYEVSFVRTRGARIVLAYRESAVGIRNLINEIESRSSYPVKDGTFAKILKRK